MAQNPWRIRQLTLPKSNEMALAAQATFLLGNPYGQGIEETPLQPYLDGVIRVMSVIYKNDNTTTVQHACVRTMGNLDPVRYGAGTMVRPAGWRLVGALIDAILILT